MGGKKEAIISEKKLRRSSTNIIESSSFGIRSIVPLDNNNGEDPSINPLFDDETDIQIIVPSSLMSDDQQVLSLAPLPSPHLSETTLEQDSSLKVKLYEDAIIDAWDYRAKSICEKYPNMVRSPLTANGDTAVHIAASANSAIFLRGLVNLAQVTPQDLEITNSDGNTAFCMAAISGNSEVLLQIMISKNQNLPLVYGQYDMLPVHLAASSGHHDIVHFLSSNDFIAKMPHKDIQRLFCLTISSNIHGEAFKLFSKYGELLATARNDEELTALHMLARKPSLKRSGSVLFEEVWRCVRRLEHNKVMELITKPSTVLFDAIESGNDEAAKMMISKNPELLTLKDPKNGRSLLHFAALHRKGSMLNYILGHGAVNLIIRALDCDRNNVLHLAADAYQSDQAWSRLNTKIQTELAWFKEVEDRVPQDLRTMKNRKGQTPKDIFYAKHRELSEEDKETAKGIANSGMLVAALIATVAFAAALTVPGGDKTTATSSWFVVFILTNTVALFTSSASIISFLSIFTSPWFIENKFIISLMLINLGLGLLIVSVATMVLSFGAASFLIFGQTFKWVSYVVVSLGVLPILLLLLLRSRYVDRLLNYFFWSRY